MVKFMADAKAGGKLLGIGLSEGNIQRLKAGQPIHFYVGEIAVDPEIREVVILYGETEDRIAKMLDGITRVTEIIDTRALPH